MFVFAFVLKYLVSIPVIAYLLTTNKRFHLIESYLNSESFYALYKPTLGLVLVYLLVIEMVYCIFAWQNTARRTAVSPLKRKMLFITYAVGSITVINLALLDYVFSLKQVDLMDTGYLTSGLFFFLGIFVAYALLVWSRPRFTIGFWLMESVVGGVMMRIREKKDDSGFVDSTIIADNCTVTVLPEPAPEVSAPVSLMEDQPLLHTFQDETEAIAPQEVRSEADGTVDTAMDALKKTVLMDILLLRSSRKGLFIYFRSGCCIHIHKKVTDLFTKEQLAWFVTYQKGARANLAHLLCGSDTTQLQWAEGTYRGFVEGSDKSHFEVQQMLSVTPVFQEKIAQELLLKEYMDKSVLSLTIFNNNN